MGHPEEDTAEARSARIKAQFETCLRECIEPLKSVLIAGQLTVWSEHGDNGWVNVNCEKHACTHEVYLQPDRDLRTGDRLAEDQG